MYVLSTRRARSLSQRTADTSEVSNLQFPRSGEADGARGAPPPPRRLPHRPGDAAGTDREPTGDGDRALGYQPGNPLLLGGEAGGGGKHHQKTPTNQQTPQLLAFQKPTPRRNPPRHSGRSRRGAGTLVGAGTRHSTAKSPPAPGPHHSRPAASGLPTGKLRFPPCGAHTPPRLSPPRLPPGGCPPPARVLLHPRGGTAQGPTGPRSPPLGGSQPAPPAAAAALTAPRRSAGARRRPPFIGPAARPARPPAPPPSPAAARLRAELLAAERRREGRGGKRRRGPEPARGEQPGLPAGCRATGRGRGGTPWRLWQRRARRGGHGRPRPLAPGPLASMAVLCPGVPPEPHRAALAPLPGVQGEAPAMAG